MLFDPKWKAGDGWLWPNRASAIAALMAVVFGPWIIAMTAAWFISWPLWFAVMVTVLVVQQALLRWVRSTYARNGWL